MKHCPDIAVRTNPRGKAFALTCAVLLLLGVPPAQARIIDQAETRVAQCIRDAASGRPWLERTLWGLRDQEAGWIGAEVRNTNGTHDLGPLQVNTWWVPKIAVLIGRPAADVRVWLQSDPCFNVGAARWIFLSALHLTRDYWAAVGVYHSPTKWRQRRYALSVERRMQRRFGGQAFSASVPSVNVAQGDAVKEGNAQTSNSSVKMHGFGIVTDPSN